MGRREQPLDPSEGPIARFAFELRKLRQEAGGPTYRAMAARVHYAAATLAQAAAGHKMPSLPVTLAYVQACGGDPEDWEQRWHEAGREHTADRAGARAPYRGLARFEDTDHDLFFGRDALVERLCALVGRHRVVLLLGPSGSGKSSLLRAGLLARLRELGSVSVLTPGRHPAVPDDDAILVDQFEEVFTLEGRPDERAAFIDALLTRAAAGARVVIAVRADFAGHCAGHRALAEAVKDATVLMTPMSRAELREAIVRPAAAAGLIVERQLTARIVEEIDGEPGGLPLMSHVLLETWRRRHGRALTTAAYEAAGGIHGAIARTSEELYAGLSEDQRRRLRRLMLRLVTPGQDAPETRRPAERAELVTQAEDELLLERLAGARLITVEQDRAEVAHEALLTAWPRLRGWIEEDRERMRLQRHLTEAANAWLELDRDPGTLYRGTRLSVAREHLAGRGDLTPLEHEFLAAGIAAHDRARRRRRRRTAAVSVLLVLALVTGTLAWQQSQIGQRRQREADARQAVGVAESLREFDPVTAMRLSLAAWQLADLPETRSALLTASGQRQQDTFVPVSERHARHHLSLDGRTLTSVGTSEISVWDVGTRRRTASLRGSGLHETGTFKGDGQRLPIVGPAGEVRLWDLPTARQDDKALGVVTDGTELSTSGRSLIGYRAIGSRYEIQVWDTADRRTLFQVRTPRDAAAGVRARPTVWGLGAPMELSSNDGRYMTDGLVPDATLSADDRLLALCVPGERLQLWDVRAGRRLTAPWAPEVTLRQCQYEHVRFTPDGRGLAVIAESEVRVWDIGSGAELRHIRHPDVRDIGFSADGVFVVTADDSEIRLWRSAAPGTPDLPAFRHVLAGEQATDLRVDPHANWIRYLSGPAGLQSTSVRTLHPGRATTAEWHDSVAVAAVFGPGGASLARAYHRNDPDDVRVQMWRPDSGRRPVELPRSPCPPEPDPFWGCAPLLAFSPDGRKLAYMMVGGDDDQPPPRLVLWDTVEQRVTDTFAVPDDGSPAGAVIFGSTSASLLVLAGLSSGATRLWDLRRRTSVEVDGGVTGYGPAFHPRHGVLVTTHGHVVHLPSGSPVKGSGSPGENSVLAFSPDGGHLAAGDDSGRVAMWDGRLTRRLGVLTPPDAAASPGAGVTALAFSPDGRVLAVARGRESVQLWDTVARRPIGSSLPTAGDYILALAFSPDGRTVYASGQRVPLQTYEISPDSAAARVCERAGGGLSPQEWETYFPHYDHRPTCPREPVTGVRRGSP
ncbi:hypothetical protein ACIBP6_12525 [Nonomuraea terrae]|uniref:nSTAND1 domain-containing NTPase n=1 Tax=Nonomuraea terrae TaxID=2530383 RepID=UPI0037AA6560